MPALTPYLFFGGRCEEALSFYIEAIGAQLEMLMRFNESPDPPPPEMLAPGFEHKVMHSQLRIGDHQLFLSDGCDESSQFSGFSLALSVSTLDEANRVFNALAEGGTITMPLSKTFWSEGYGMLTDRFNVNWMVMVAS